MSKNFPRHQQKEQEKQINIQRTTTQIWQAPFPPPEILAQLKEIDPDIPKQIMNAFEAESAHRRKLEMRSMGTASISMLLGYICAILSVATLSYLAYYMTSKGYPKQAAAIVGATLGVIVTAFLGRKIINNITKP